MIWPFVSRKRFDKLIMNNVALQEKLEEAEKREQAVLDRCLAEIYKGKERLDVEQSSFEAVYKNLRYELEKKR
jgi:hypothetical protein